MSELSLADFDLERLTDRSREILEKVALPMADGQRRRDHVEIADELSEELGLTGDERLTAADIRDAIAELREEMEAQRDGAKLRPLSHDEFEALKESIRQHGQLTPIVKEGEVVLDGRHRLRACEELGLEPWIVPPLAVGPQGPRLEPHEYDLVANVVRRHLSASQRRKAIAQELIHDEGRSDRAVALIFGVSHVTVGTVRKELQERGQVVKLTSRRSRDGRTRPVEAPRHREKAVIARESDADRRDVKSGIVLTVEPTLAGSLAAGWSSPCRIRLEQIGHSYQLVAEWL